MKANRVLVAILFLVGAVGAIAAQEQPAALKKAAPDSSATAQPGAAVEQELLAGPVLGAVTSPFYGGADESGALQPAAYAAADSPTAGMPAKSDSEGGTTFALSSPPVPTTWVLLGGIAVMVSMARRRRDWSALSGTALGSPFPPTKRNQRPPHEAATAEAGPAR